MATVKYLYTGTTAPTVALGSLQAVTGDFNSNPIFNFDQAFLDGLNSITPPQMGASVPYISLKILDPSGAVLEDLNLGFFHKPFSADQIRSDVRYSERPVMSLKDIQLKADLASGYLYYTNVTLNIKVHRPDALGSTFLIALLFPGMPFLLEYGWSSPNTLLDTRDILLFAVKTYNIKLDQTGQIDLTIEGTAFNERFGNTLVGDLGVPPVKNQKTTTEELDGLERYRNQVQHYSAYLADMRSRSNSTINDYSIIKEFAEVYKKIENKSRGDVSGKFSTTMKTLRGNSQRRDIGPKLRGIEVIPLHDLIYTLCNDTFAALGNTISGIQEFRITYGTFNAKAGIYANKSIAEFPIDLKKFKSKIGAGHDNGIHVPTIQFLLNTLQESFLENEDYFKSNLTQKPANAATFTPDVFNKPDVVSHFISRKEGGPDGLIVMELYIVDINSGLPITTAALANLNRASQADAEQAVAGATNFPIMRLGHANSFIKTITLTQISDQNMKAALIERMTRDRVVGPRSTITQKESQGAAPVTPLTLPLKGNASVVGHPGWKPFRAFYLSTGFFLIDGVYKITGVTQSLSAGEFNTDIEFMWH